MISTYKAQNDRRSVWQQLEAGWQLKYHPKTQAFYSLDPKNPNDTFGSRSLSKQEVRNAVKKKILKQIDTIGELFTINCENRLI